MSEKDILATLTRIPLMATSDKAAFAVQVLLYTPRSRCQVGGRAEKGIASPALVVGKKGFTEEPMVKLNLDNYLKAR